MSSTANNRKLIYILIPFALTLGMALDIYLPSIPSISTSLSTSISMVQWTMSGFFLCFGIGQLLVGPISDHIGRKRTIFWSLLLYVSGAVTAALSPNIEILILARLIQAFGAAGTQISAFSIAKDSIKDKQTSEQVFTYLKGSMGFAPIVAPIIGSFLEYHFNWRAPFFVLAVFGAFLMGLNYRSIEESLAEEDRTKLSFGSISSYFSMMKDMRFMSLSICVVSTQAVLFSFFSLSPHIIISTLGYDERFFGICFAINALTYSLASIISARALTHIGAMSCIRIGGIMLFGAAILLICLLKYKGLGVITLMLPTLIASSGTSFIMGPATSMAVDSYKRVTGTATAFIGSLEAISAAAIGNIAVAISDFNGETFAYIVAISGIAVLLSQRFARNY